MFRLTDELDARLPFFVHQPQSSVVRTGGDVVLRCSAGPPDVSIVWQYNNRTVATQNAVAGMSVNGTTLHIRSFIRARHEGVYQCTASNSYGSVLSQQAHLVEAGYRRFTFCETTKERVDRSNLQSVALE